jgi:Na+/H+ antiporter NhaD/arsenite permease-like protein
MSTDILWCLAIFAVTYAFIVSERVPPATAAIIGGALVVFLQLIPHEVALESVDLEVVFLLTGMMIVVNILSETGLFEWVAVTIAQRSKGNGIVILAGLTLSTAVLSAFLDNVTTVVLIVPITILITQILDLPVMPFLILEAIFSNIGGTATLVGDPPNILIGAQTHLTFNDFLLNLAPAILILVLLLLVIVVVLLRKHLYVAPEARERIMIAQPEKAITDGRLLSRALPVFFLILLGFVFAHGIGVQPSMVALLGAFVMLVVTKSDMRRQLEKVEWETIFFLIGLFMLVGALEYNGLFEHMGAILADFTGGNMLLATLSVLWAAGVLAAFLSAVPVTIALIPLVSAYIVGMGGTPGQHDPAFDMLWWALALGACLGGNGTMLGAPANLLVVQIARKNRYHVSFYDFARYGIPVLILSLVLSSFYLYVRYFLLA